MKLAIMQPYFLPYLGYFQLISAADKFVVYDNIQFTKKGWINRNRMLVNNTDKYFTLPLKKESDFLNVVERSISDDFKKERIALLAKIKEAYRKAPFFDAAYPLLESIFNHEEKNLFRFIHNSLQQVCKYLNIRTKFIISSSVPIDHQLKSQDKVIAICKALDASQYINPAGGTDLYSKEIFKQQDIELVFLKTDAIQYQQFNDEFIPALSIIDVMMFNSNEQINKYLSSFTIK